MRNLMAVSVFLATAALAAPAVAQIGAPQVTADTPMVDELIVRAYGGPAWWKVSDADTTVYILAAPGMPVAPGWDQSLLKKRLAGANEVIGPPQLSGGGIGMLLALPAMNGLVRDINKNRKSTLEPSLPPDLRARFVATRERFKLPAERYGALEPGLAGMALEGDAWHALFPEPANPPQPPPGSIVEQVVADAAKAARVKAKPAATYGGSMFRRALGDLRKPGVACLKGSLDDIDAAPKSQEESPEARARRVAVAAAWAEGDVRPLITAARRGNGGNAILGLGMVRKDTSVRLRISSRACFDAMPSLKDVSGIWLADETEAVARALRKRGHAVAVISYGDLLMKDGVLDRLQKRGFKVTPPGGEN